MSHDCMITQRLLSGQRTMFRLAECGFGFSQKAISIMAGMSLSAVGQYARGETAMSGPAILKLSAVKEFPAELLTLLYAGTGRIVADDLPPGASTTADYDDVAMGALAFAGEVQKARSENSPGGTAIVTSEEEIIRKRAARLATQAKRAA